MHAMSPYTAEFSCFQCGQTSSCILNLNRTTCVSAEILQAIILPNHTNEVGIIQVNTNPILRYATCAHADWQHVFHEIGFRGWS